MKVLSFLAGCMCIHFAVDDNLTLLDVLLVGAAVLFMALAFTSKQEPVGIVPPLTEE